LAENPIIRVIRSTGGGGKGGCFGGQRLVILWFYIDCRRFFHYGRPYNPPCPPLKKGGNYKEILLKSPFDKGGQGDLRTSKRKEFMANDIIYGGGSETASDTISLLKFMDKLPDG
jgi:hypothetical protein